MSTGFVATTMIPPGFALATAGTIWRKISAFLRTRSILVSPGFWAAPAAMTVIADPRQSSIGPDQTRAVFANGTACRRSIASPSARRAFASTSRISDASPERRRPNANVDPTAPAPTTATRVGWASGCCAAGGMDSVARDSGMGPVCRDSRAPSGSLQASLHAERVAAAADVAEARMPLRDELRVDPGEVAAERLGLHVQAPRPGGAQQRPMVDDVAAPAEVDAQPVEARLEGARRERGPPDRGVQARDQLPDPDRPPDHVDGPGF